MSNNARDTQFQGFAKVLIDELLEIEGVYIDTWRENLSEVWQDLLARRAYDLVRHTLDYADIMHMDSLAVYEHVERIPDLLELPKEQE